MHLLTGENPYNIDPRKQDRNNEKPDMPSIVLLATNPVINDINNVTLVLMKICILF
jgi:hypothetical protein